MDAHSRMVIVTHPNLHIGNVFCLVYVITMYSCLPFF